MTTNIRLLTSILLLGLFSSAHSMHFIFGKPQQPLMYRLGAQVKEVIKNNYKPFAVTAGSSMLIGSLPFLIEVVRTKYKKESEIKDYYYMDSTKKRAKQGAKAVLFSLAAAGAVYAPPIAVSYLTKNIKSATLKSHLDFLAKLYG